LYNPNFMQIILFLTQSKLFFQALICTFCANLANHIFLLILAHYSLLFILFYFIFFIESTISPDGENTAAPLRFMLATCLRRARPRRTVNRNTWPLGIT